MSLINPFNIFRKKQELSDYDSNFVMIRKTNASINSFVNDQFNKKLSFFKSWWHYKKDLPTKEIPFTNVDARNIRDVLGLPIIEERLTTDFDFEMEENFGEVKMAQRL